MKKKKILFVMDTFPLGGISKSLLALFNQLGDRYKIDFFLMHKDGLFVPLIPKSVNVISDLLPEEFRSPNPKYLFKNFFSLDFCDWLKWVQFSILCSLARLRGGLYKMVNVMDSWLAKHTPSIDEHYDAAIAYQGGRCIYYIIEKINADVKIGYVHNNYSSSPIDFMLKPMDNKYFPKLDYIVTISNICLRSLLEEFPLLTEKCLVIENICSPKLIRQNAKCGESFNDSFRGCRIVTICRLDIWQKGIDFAIDVCKILKDRNIQFKWYLLGDGEQRSKIESMVDDMDVADCFILLGAKVNPYPYVANADIYVQTSRVEGKSVALDEVKALAKPIVVTNFSSVNDQFINENNALIAEMEPVDIANKIERLINDSELCNILIGNLKKEKIGNEEQVQIFESLLNGYKD